MSAFAQAGIVVCLSWYIYYLTRRFDRIGHLLWVVLHQIFSKIWLPIVPCPSFRDAAFELIEGPAPEPNQKPSCNDARRFLKIMELQDVILNLSDMHTFAAISFLIAAITQTSLHPRMELYHMSLVHQVVWMACNSHQVALFYVYTSRTPHIGERCAALMAFLVLFLVFEALYLWQLVVHEKYTDWCLSDLAAHGKKRWAVASIALVSWSYLPFVCLYMDREDDEKKLQGVGAGASIGNAGNTCKCAKQASPGTPPGDLPERTAAQIKHNKRLERFNKFRNVRVALYLVWRLINSKSVAQAMLLVWYCIQVQETWETRDSYGGNLENSDDEDRWGFGQVVSITAFVGVIFQFFRAYGSLSHPPPGTRCMS